MRYISLYLPNESSPHTVGLSVFCEGAVGTGDRIAMRAIGLSGLKLTPTYRGCCALAHVQPWTERCGSRRDAKIARGLPAFGGNEVDTGPPG